ncbi:MAG: hypothetical protein NPIRA05_11600 [Nitrospirales bacterium]|nr:MAG: hypothetical protein NPIRA05_11600 [Nitrospirales bacterium]
MKSYSKSVCIDASAETVYRALTSELGGWWTTAAEDASLVGTEFVVRFGETFNRIKVEMLDLNREVRWRVVEQYHASDKLTRHDEWNGTSMVWRITPNSESRVNLDFQHDGLVRSGVGSLFKGKY